MQRRTSWLFPSKAEWRAMLWGGLYVLAGHMLLRLLFGFFLAPVGGFSFWVRPLVLLSWILTDFNSLILFWGIPSLLASVLCGMLGGLFICRRLRRQAGQRPISAGDGWRAGAWVGAWMAIPLVLLFILTPFGILPTRQRIVEAAARLSSGGIWEYRSEIIYASLILLLIMAAGAVLGRVLLARGVAANVETGVQAADGSTQKMASSPGCVGLLALAFLSMYFYAEAYRQLPKPIPSRFMTTGDFGIVSQEPCGPPCLQGITPGVTTIKDAYFNLLKAGARCRVDVSRSAEEDIRCFGGKSYIVIQSPLGLGHYETDEAKLVVETIVLQPPGAITVGQLIALYGPPDSVLASGHISILLNYDRLRTFVIVTVQTGTTHAITPDTTIYEVHYQTAAAYKQSHQRMSGLQPWKGYGDYAYAAGPLPPFMATGDFGIISGAASGAPSFLGIRAGTTTFDDAVRIVEDTGASCSSATDGQGKFLECMGGDAAITISTSGLCGGNIAPLVGGVGLHPPDRITLGEFIDIYGPPDSLTIENGQRLYYEDRQVALILAPPEESPGSHTITSYTIMPNTVIAVVIYLSNGTYADCLQKAGEAIRQWHGYGAYDLSSASFAPWVGPAALPTKTPPR